MWASSTNKSSQSCLYAPQWPHRPDKEHLALPRFLCTFFPLLCTLTVVWEREKETLYCVMQALTWQFPNRFSGCLYSFAAWLARSGGTKGNMLFTARQGTPVIICEVKKIHLHSRRGPESTFIAFFPPRLFSQVLWRGQVSAEASRGVWECRSPPQKASVPCC